MRYRAPFTPRRRGILDLLSLAPRQQLKSFAERLILPCGLVILSFLQDLRQVQARSSPRRYGDRAVHAGAPRRLRRRRRTCCSVHRDLRRSGIRPAAQTRRTFRPARWAVTSCFRCGCIPDGGRFGRVSPEFVDMLGGPATTLTLAFGAIVLAWATYVLPALDLAGWWQGADGSASALILALAGSGAAIGLHIAAMVHFRVPFWYGSPIPAWLHGGCIARAR